MVLAAPGDPIFVVALTGGIASGKSLVSGQFERLGVPVIDMDLVARDLVEPGQPLLSSIVTAFGKELLDAYGRLRRRQLRDLIFSDAEKRTQLEALLHPRIVEESLKRIAAVKGPYCVLVIPLLAEIDRSGVAHQVLVVDAPEEMQIQRLMVRDGVTREQAELALAAQTTREKRLALADDVIENSGEIADLTEQVDALHRKYLNLGRWLRSDNSTPES
jgi:dephospho-CoA kinase